MKIVYMGTPDFAVAPLEALIQAGHQISAVVTQPDKQKGRGKEVQMTPVKDITVSEGGFVSQGEIIGSVAAPTKYFSVEGCNVYFKLTKDGVPVNPMTKLK